MYFCYSCNRFTPNVVFPHSCSLCRSDFIDIASTETHSKPAAEIQNKNQTQISIDASRTRTYGPHNSLYNHLYQNNNSFPSRFPPLFVTPEGGIVSGFRFSLREARSGITANGKPIKNIIDNFKMQNAIKIIEQKGEDQGLECSICLDTLGIVVAKLPNCQHVFHTHCIKKWIDLKNKCPLCLRIVV